MSYYWNSTFLKQLDLNNIKHICEVGARYGDESIKLSEVFNKSTIYAFECNPNTIEVCRTKLQNYKQIKFYDCGLGHQEIVQPFYSFNQQNDGASSFLKRIDFDKTQKYSGNINIRKLSNIVKEENIPYLDLLCMDVQGYELNILIGCDNFIQNIKYIIMEEPKKEINTNYLPENIYSKYIDAPSHDDIKQFMNNNNFVEIARIAENKIEDNVMYKNTTINI